MLFLSKEVTKKDKILETQFQLTTNNEKGSETKKIWKRSGFFGDHDSDADKTFFLTGMTEYSLLYSVSKKTMPNTFQGTCFKKYVSQILDERSARDFSDIFFCLLSTTDRNDKINNFTGNV